MKKFSLLLIALLLIVTTGFYFLSLINDGKAFSNGANHQLSPDWPNLPKGLILGNPTGIGIDKDQNILVFYRASREWPLIGAMPTEKIRENTILILDRTSGKIINSWGSNIFVMPHGLNVDTDNNVWLTDVGLHQVFKFNHDGKLLMTLGEAGVAGNGHQHFDKPTDVAVAKDGSFYVSDGYGNSRIVKFSPDGKYLTEWGKKGNAPSEFNIPHAVTIGPDGNVYVADRENKRIQEFTADGKFIKQWTDDSYGNICSVGFDPTTKGMVAVEDKAFLYLKHLGSNLMTFDSTGKQSTRIGRSGLYNGPKCWYHDMVTDTDGNIYVADILSNRLQKFAADKVAK